MRIFLASLVGGILLFIWSLVSWSVLDWHQASWQQFTNESEAEKIFHDFGDEKGFYVLPSPKFLSNKEWQKKLERGPFFMGVLRSGIKKNTPMLLVNWFLVCVAQAFCVTLLLSMTRLHSSITLRFFFVVVAGLLCAFATHVPNAIWFEHPLGLTLIRSADVIIGFIFLGAPCAIILRPKAR